MLRWRQNGQLIQLFIGPTERQNAQVNEQFIASITYRADDGSVRFTLNINRFVKRRVQFVCTHLLSCTTLQCAALRYAQTFDVPVERSLASQSSHV